MRIAIVGGAGFVGARLSGMLRRTHRLLVYDNLFARKTTVALDWLPEVEFIQADILNYQRLAASLRAFRPEVLYHLAAIPFIPYCEQHPARTIRMNVEGTVNVMRAAQSCASLRGVIFTSSADVYGASAQLH